MLLSVDATSRTGLPHILASTISIFSIVTIASSIVSPISLLLLVLLLLIKLLLSIVIGVSYQSMATGVLVRSETHVEIGRFFEVSEIFAVDRKIQRRLEASLTCHMVMCGTWKSTRLRDVMHMWSVAAGISWHAMAGN